MPIEDEILLLHAYVDGELDTSSALAIKARIEADPALVTELAGLERLRAAVRSAFPLEPPSAELRRRISRIGAPPIRARPTWSALAASVMLAVGVSAGSTWLTMDGRSGDRVAGKVLDSHLRSLIAAAPTDVASSERHTVKPWFNGRIPQAPRVVDLKSEGFPLLGARIDVIAKTRVPTLVYGRRLHVISLAALPGAAEAAIPARSDAGYNMIGWTTDGISYLATSDLNRAELEAFAKLFREAP